MACKLISPLVYAVTLTDDRSHVGVVIVIVLVGNTPSQFTAEQARSTLPTVDTPSSPHCADSQTSCNQLAEAVPPTYSKRSESIAITVYWSVH